MPRILDLIILVATLSIITFLCYRAPIHGLPVRPRAQQPLSKVNEKPYIAPLLGCDGSKSEVEIIKDRYEIFLHKMYPVSQHKKFPETGGVHLNSTIGSIDNETESHGVIYRAKFDDEALAVVRSDIGVDVLLCQTKAYPLELI